MSPRIAAVMIVKNEEKVLERCLKTLADLDEIVILDTGSEDRTLEIARKYTSKVRTWELENFHFANARNEAISDVESEWMLAIDADEILREGSVEALREAVTKLGTVGYRINFELEAPEHGKREIVPKFRFWRKKYFLWQGRVHEQLMPTRKVAPVGDLPACVIEHHPYTDQTTRNRQNFELLEASVEEDPYHIAAFKHLGLEYILQKKWKEAIEPLSHYISLANDPPLELSDLLIQLGRALAATGNLEKSVETFEKAIKVAPQRREPWYQCALELIKVGQIPAAIYFLEGCLKIPVSRKPTFHLNSEAVWGKVPEETLAWCKARLEDMKAKAKEKGLPFPG